MSRITFLFVWLMVFIVPFEEQVSIERFSSAARMLGYAALVFAFFAVIIQGGIRRPPPTHMLLAMFWAWCVVSLAWTIHGEQSIGRVITFTGVFLFAWLVWEFAPTLNRQNLLMGAYVLGYCVSLADESLAFLHSDVGPQFTEDTGRLTGGGLNQNDIAIVGAIVIPIAAYLALRAVKNPILRVGCWALIPVAALGVVMTGSRSGTAAMLLGVSVLTLSLRRATWGFRIMFIVAGLAGAMLVMYLAPERILARVSEGTESATFQTRHEVWMLALQRWADSPILGSGVGTFIRAVWGSTGGLVAHNAFISVLVETGVVGLMFYAGAVLTTFYYVWRLPAEDRPFFLAILVIWIVAAMVGPWEYNKTSWFLFSILTTISVTKQAATSAQKGLASPSPPALVASPLGGSRLGPA